MNILNMLTRSLCAIILVGLCVSARQAFAQESSKVYTIQVGDQLDVTIEGYPEYSRQLPVLPNGMISYPRVGDLKVEGMTPSALANLISQRLTSLGNPRVYVSVLAPQQNMIYVEGMVRLPGRYFFEEDTIYLLQALALAGGLDYDKADRQHVRIFRNGTLIGDPVDITGLMNGQTDRDIELLPNDMVLVPSLLQQRPIFVTGSVMAPGSFDIEEPQVHVLRALWMAGGPIQDLADPARAVIIHPDNRVTPVDLESLAQDPTLQSDLYMMAPGDVLFVPNAYENEKVSVIGEVKSPGPYSVKGPIDVIEALSLAGGVIQDQANLKKAFIQRRDGTREPVNLTDFLDSEADVSGLTLYPGDTLTIPKRLKINWSALYTVVLTASLIYNIATR